MSKEDDFIYDAANEAIVIGAALSDPEARKVLVHSLSADEFLVPKHGVIWKAIRHINDRKLSFDSEVVKRVVSDVGGDKDTLAQIKSLQESATTPKNLDWHVETMVWDATRARTLKGPLPNLVRLLNDPKAEQGEILSTAHAVSRALEEKSGRRQIRRPGELYREYRAEIAMRRVKRNVFPLGEEAFDQNLSEGFMPGKTWVSAGLPGSGKSTVWTSNAIRLARIGRRPLYCCWEMSPASILDVAVSHMTGIELTRIIQGGYSDEEQERIDQASRWINKRIKFMGNPFFDRSKKKPSIERNLDILEGYIAESGCDVVIYDLWARMIPRQDPNEVESALFQLQAIHEEYGVAGVVVQQLNSKDVEKRADKRPTRDSIKGSGAYVEVADVILGIHREAQFKAVDDVSVETICLKQRKGKFNWAVRWKWDGARCLVSDPEEVPFDPGLEAASEVGDVGSVREVKQIKTGRSRKIGRRE